MADKKISQLPNLDRVNYTTSDLLLINNGLAPYSAQTTSNTLVFDFLKYYTGVTNYITGVTFNLGVLTMYLNGTVQTIPVTGLTNTYLTGGTYSKALSAMTFTNNTGGTFSVTGMYFPKVPAGTLNSIQYNNNQRFSGNTLIYNSGTTSIYNKGYNGVVSNTFYGENAGGKTSAGFQTVLGAFSFSGLSSSGGYNDLFGGYTLSAATSAYNNSFFGYGRGRKNTSKSLSVGFGSNPNEVTVIGNENVTFGYSNFIDKTLNRQDSQYCVAIGNYSQESLSSSGGIVDGNNTSIGFSSLKSYFSQGNTVSIGSYSMSTSQWISGKDSSVGIGVNSSKTGANGSTRTISSNVVIGSNTLLSNTLQNSNSILLGNNLITYNSYTWAFNILLGEGTGSYTYASTNEKLPKVSIGYKLYPTGSIAPGSNENNHVIGYNTGSAFANSSFIGYNILPKYRNKSASNCVLLGSNIFTNSTNTSNTADGRAYGIVMGSNIYNNVNGNYDLTIGSIFLGNFIGYTSTNGQPMYNVVMGYSAGYNLTSPLHNTIIGNFSNYNLSNGSYVTSIGNETQYNSNNEYCTSIGYRSGYGLTGSTNTQNTFIGAYAGSNLKGGSNNTLIGFSAQASTTIVSNEITLGNSSITSLRSNVTSITSLSDIRDKKDINTLSIGLNVINDLNPVTFSWNMRDNSKVGIKSSGFIAQEVLSVEENYNLSKNFNLVYKSNPEKLEISSWSILPIMVKSLQDLSKKNKELKERIKKITI